MKQGITIDQFKELSELNQRKLYKWANSNSRNYLICGPFLYKDMIENGCFPLLSIGQMIEFLEKEYYDWHFYLGNNMAENTEICDILWEAVKEILEK